MRSSSVSMWRPGDMSWTLTYQLSSDVSPTLYVNDVAGLAHQKSIFA